MEEKRNLYEILGIDKKASAEEVKKAYRKKSMEHHPDKGGTKEAFEEINKAYEILSDERKKKFYDELDQIYEADFKSQLTLFMMRVIIPHLVKIETQTFERINHLSEAKTLVREILNNDHLECKEARAKMYKMKKIIRRTKKKDNANTDHLEPIFDIQLTEYKKEVAEIEVRIDFLKFVQGILSDYDFNNVGEEENFRAMLGLNGKY